ncbi:MAG: hypothetical protein H0X26_04075 [Alphaproteobacteria bacterium]|nr:hypothetical protein [Alphaproteobacteria bacterium]
MNFYNTKRRHQGVHKMRPADLYLEKSAKIKAISGNVMGSFFVVARGRQARYGVI